MTGRRNTLCLRTDGSTITSSDLSGTVHWTLSLNDLVLISEYTTDEGPFVDDYFLVFATIESGKLLLSTCSFYAEGTLDVLTKIEERLGTPVELGLVNSAEWKSRVVWPPRLAGQQYFTFRPVPATTALQRLRKLVLGPTLEYGDFAGRAGLSANADG